MRSRGKNQHNSHCSYSPKKGASTRRWAPVEGGHYDNFAAFEKRICAQTLPCVSPSRVPTATLFQSETHLTSHCNAAQPPRDDRAGRVTRCAAGLPVRSISLLRSVGVCSWVANQQEDGGDGQNVLGKKTSLSRFSAVASSSQRAASSQVTGSPSKSTSRAASVRPATPTSSLPASRSPTHKLCTRSTARCSPNECRSESNQRQVRSAGKPQGPRKTKVNSGRKVASRRDCRAAVCARGDEPRASILRRAA
jgi:hypothetical protein